MAFCTECGFKLPDDAVFCPNCGASLTVTTKGENEAVVEEIKTDNCGASVCEPPKVESCVGIDTASGQSSGEHQQTAQGCYSATIQGTYSPLVQKDAAPPYQGGNVQQPLNPYNVPTGYGYQPTQGNKTKSNGGKIAAIVISSVVILILLASYLIYRAFSVGNSYVGYWESSAIDNGNGELTDNYMGENVVGLLGIQIKNDSSAYLASAFNNEVYDAQWVETEDGIEITDENDTYELTIMDGKLFLQNEAMYIVFEKSDGDIDNPSVPHGSLSGSGEDGLINDPDMQTNNRIAGSGYVGNENYYISFIGATDFTDVDGEPAMRVYYEFTNYFDYSISAWDALGFYVTQDGNELQEAFAYDESDVYYNQTYNIRPGITIQSYYEFKYDPDGGSVDISCCGWEEGDENGAVSASYVPGNLPGEPAPYVIKPVSDPQWTLNIPGQGTLENCYEVSVLDAELIDDIEGKPAVRIYYEFTNNSNYNTSLAEALYTYTYQDGISLEMTYAYTDTDTDINFNTQITPGTKITVSCIYVLRNATSPVEAEIEAYSSYDAIGQTYDIS